MTDKTISFSLNGELLVDPAVGDAAFNEVVGKKHALKRYDQFALNTT